MSSQLEREKVVPLGRSEAEQPLVMQTPNKFRVHTRAYTDPGVFQMEMERIFNKTWVYVGHTSEIPNRGDFKTSHIGLQPVIMTRSDDDRINVVVNRCMHRGTVVCRETTGNAKEFSCPYHGWLYANDGKLIAVADRKALGGYADDFEAPEGLFRLPCIEVYRGFVFASFNADVPPLLDHLGARAKRYIDRKLDLSPEGEIVLCSKPYVVRFQANWKFQAENIIDATHFLQVHKGFVTLQAKYGDTTGDFGQHKGGSSAAMRKIRFSGQSWRTRQGHGVSENPDNDVESLLNGEYGEFYRRIRDLRGEDELPWLAGKGVVSLFPNMGMIFQQVRVWRPIAPDLTEVSIYLYELKGAPASFNEGVLRSQERFYGPSGYGAVDDVEIFMLSQQGMQGSAVEWLIFERGLGSDEKMEDGDYRGISGSEAPLRARWTEWNRLMTRG